MMQQIKQRPPENQQTLEVWLLRRWRVLRTSEDFLPEIRQQFHIDDARDDTFERAKLRVDAQSEEHEEKEDWPKLSAWKLIDGFREDDES